MRKPTGDYVQNPDSPLRDPERLAAEFGLPYRKKKRRWEVTEGSWKRVSEAGKGDHARGQSPEERARFNKNYDLIDWSDDGKEDSCPADVQAEPDGSSND